MASLFLLVNVLVFAGLQFLYLAQSLVVVDHSTAVSRGRQWQQKRYGIQTQRTCYQPSKRRPKLSTRLLRQGPANRAGSVSGSASASVSASSFTSTTAIAFASTDDNSEEDTPKSLKEILDELTDRGISFSPMASRSELEELLLESTKDSALDSCSELDPIGNMSPTLSEEAMVAVDDGSNGGPNQRKHPQNESREEQVEQQRKRRQIENRMQRRRNRSRRRNIGTTEEIPEETYPMSSPPSSRQRRSMRRETERSPADRMEGDSSFGNNYDSVPRDARSRQRRRRQRVEQQPPSLLDSISDTMPITEVVDMGFRASRIARRKTGKIWKELVDYAYEEEEGEIAGRQSGRPRRRERRRSGYNWQQSSPPNREGGSQRRKRRRDYSSMDDRGTAANDDDKISSNSNYYTDEEDELRREEESLRTQKREQRRESRRRRHQEPFDPKTRQKVSSASATSEMQGEKLPIGQILTALNERNIPYSPRSTREELEMLLLEGLGDNNAVAVKQAEEDNIEVIEVESISPEDWQKQQEEKLQQKQKEQQQKQGNSSPTGQKPNTQPEQTEGSTTSTSRKHNFNRRSVNYSYRPSGFSTTTAKAYGAGYRRRQRSQPESAPGSSAKNSSSQYPPPPKSFSVCDNDGTDLRDASTSNREDSTGRRIYSPFSRRGKRPESVQSSRSSRRRKERKNKYYDDIEDDLDRFGDVMEDDLGRFGDFLGDSVDNIFWGSGDSVESSSSPQANYNTEGEEGRTSPNRRRRKSHWKDRAEERLDKILGVHKVGVKTYDRWAEEAAVETEEDEARGYDAVSFTKGRKRPRRSSTRSRKRPKKAFWEEDESIFSVLLGHNWDDSRPPQRSLRTNIDDIFGAFRSSNTMTALLRNLFVVTTRIVVSLCKWASVRDTIPRPVILLGSVGTGFVSRPGSRIKNTILSLLVIRVFGEWLSEPVDGRYDRKRPRSQRSSEVQQNDYKTDEDHEANEWK